MWHSLCRGRVIAVGLVAVSLMSACSTPEPEKNATGSETEPSAEPLPSPSEATVSRTLGSLSELPKGTNRTSGEGATVVRFKVSRGWWGEQESDTGWVIVWGKDGDFAHAKSSLWVDELDLKFEKAVSNFKQVRNLDPGDPTERRIDGHNAQLFAARVTKGDHALLDRAFGIGVDVVASVETRQALVDLGATTLLVRIELPKGEKYLPQTLRTLRSFRFSD